MKLLKVWKVRQPVHPVDVIQAEVNRLYVRQVLLVQAEKLALSATDKNLLKNFIEITVLSLLTA